MQVVLHHLNRAGDVARPEEQAAPFAARREVAHIEEAECHERPHQREVPVERACEPAAEADGGRELGAFQRIQVGGRAAVAETRVPLIDLQSTREHPGEQEQGGPLRQAHDPVVASYERAGGGGRGGGAHGLSILSFIRGATLLGAALLAALACRGGTPPARTAAAGAPPAIPPRRSAGRAR